MFFTDTSGGLVAHWKLDESAGTVAGDSEGGNDGALVNGPVWQPAGGHIDGALQFDGSDDYVSTPFILDPATGPFTACAWVKSGGTNEVILSQTDGSGSTGRVWLYGDESTGRLKTYLGGPMVSSFNHADGNWHHVALVWDGLRRYLYGDGTEVAADSSAISVESSDGDMYIGARKSLNPVYLWNGLIDDVRIYDYALDSSEIATLASQ